MEITIGGIAWYKEEQWNYLVSVCKDNLSSSYAEWLKGAEKVLKKRIIDGVRFIKVEIDVDELIAFCASQGLDINGKARTSLVNHKLGDMVRNNKIPI